jgi:hypothetical protein
MAFLVQRPGGRYEIRESAVTDRGPRARTLVSFRELSDEVLDRAGARAVGALDRDALRERARELGVPVADRDPTTDLLARRLLARLATGATVSGPLATLLVERLGPVEAPDGLEGAVEWLGATDAQRGHALWDLLELADALPDHDRGLTFPPLRRAA